MVMKMASGGKDTNPQCDGGPEDLATGAAGCGQAPSQMQHNVTHVFSPNSQVGSLHAQNVQLTNPVLVNVNVPPGVYRPECRPSGPQDEADEALGDPAPLAEELNFFREKDLKVVVNGRHLAAISKCFSEDRQCKWLARKMELDNTTMSSMTQKWGKEPDELAYKIMLSWIRLNPERTVLDLWTALRYCHSQRAINKLKEVLERE